MQNFNRPIALGVLYNVLYKETHQLEFYLQGVASTLSALGWVRKSKKFSAISKYLISDDRKCACDSEIFYVFFQVKCIWAVMPL